MEKREKKEYVHMLSAPISYKKRTAAAVSELLSMFLTFSNHSESHFFFPRSQHRFLRKSFFADVKEDIRILQKYFRLLNGRKNFFHANSLEWSHLFFRRDSGDRKAVRSSIACLA